MSDNGTQSSETRICTACGRSITWRRKWARDWQHIKYCSAACRRHGVDSTDEALQAAIEALLDKRAAGATICPSEAAKRVAGNDEAQWRPLMEPARRAARRLVAAGKIDITQGSHPVDPSTARGPIRLRMKKP